MEAVKLWLGILYGTGLTSYIAAILLNIGSWKSNVLFFVGFLFACVRLIFYVVSRVQQYQIRKLEIQKQKRDMDRDIFE